MADDEEDDEPLEMMRMARAWLAHCLGCTVDEIPEGATCEIAMGVDGQMHLEASVPGVVGAVDCEVKLESGNGK